jgi:2-dehydro-3-deoxyglucarate aldolase
MVQRLVRTIELNGTPPLVRVGENDANLIKQVMDTGAYGVIVPMINTAENARRAVESVKYPPAGKRGVGLSRAQGYGLSFEQYRRWLSKESVVIAIIEHINAIENLEEILSVEGIDATMIGPYDLSGSMGFPGQFERHDVQACIKRYMNVCRKFNKPTGFHVVEPKADRLQKKIKEGFRFLSFGTDALFLARGIQQRMTDIKRK